MEHWNIFRYIADTSHLVSIALLLYKMHEKKTCVGVSLKTNILYLSVYLLRYINPYLFDPPLYNLVFKIFFICTSIYIIYLIKVKYNPTYEVRHDTFRIIFVYVVSLILALLTTPSYNIFFITHSYSLWIEAFAIVPQLFLLNRSSKIDIINRDYIFFLSIYRLFYLINWLYKLFTDTGSTRANVWLSGITQTVIYSDFIYEYLKMKVSGKEYELPY